MTKSFLFSTAAVLVTVTAASAADLPNKKAAPVEYVKVCKVGEGKMGFVVPGTDTCLQIGGFARFQSDVTPTYRDKSAAVTKFGAVGSLKAVAYNQTEMGLLTGRVRVDVDQKGGVGLDIAYMNLGGFSAGYFGSAYKFYDGAFGVGSAYSPSGAGNKPVQIQYALTAGPATVTLAIEDSQRAETSLGGGVATATYAGQRVPDVVAAIDATFGMATVHLGGALHQVSAYDYSLEGGPVVSALRANSKWGFAVLGGVQANFTPADTLYIEAAYTSGATSRSESWGGGFKNFKTVGAFGDFIVDDSGSTPSIKLIDTWYGLAAFQHTWTPTISTFVAASYLVVDLPKIGDVATGSGNQLKLGLGATWTPVKNLSVSPEVAYINATVNNTAKETLSLDKKSESSVTARLRIQRDF